MPVAAWICAGVALLSGLTWSLITPAFHVPDEISHFAYAQYLAETANPPRHVRGDYMSEEQLRALVGLRFFTTIGNDRHRPVWTTAGERRLRDALFGDHGRVSDGASSTAVNNPPLFYALQAVPYHAASSGTILDRLFAMRLVSVLLAALAVLCVFLFLREAFPGTPWAWTVGALAVALHPLFGFISSGVNNDAGLFFASALLFLTLARCLRHGLTPGRGVALGAVLGLGVVTKLTFVAFVPAAVLALGVMAWRARGSDARRALVVAGVALAVAAVPFGTYVALNELAWDREVFGSGVGAHAAPAREDPGEASTGGLVSYAWQLYLPRLPFQDDVHAGVPLRDLWLNGLIGRFGWLDYGFRPWVYDLGFGVALVLAALALAGAVRLRAMLIARAGELAVYALAALGLMALVARAGYSAFISLEFPFEQARYLLPLLPLYASVLVLAARGAGRRLERSVAAAIVVLAIAHMVGAQLLTLSRYYG